MATTDRPFDSQQEAAAVIANYKSEMLEIERTEGPGAVWEACGEPAAQLRPTGSSYLYTLYYDTLDGWSAFQSSDFGCDWPLYVEPQDAELGPADMTPDEVAGALFTWAAQHPPLPEDPPVDTGSSDGG